MFVCRLSNVIPFVLDFVRIEIYTLRKCLHWDLNPNNILLNANCDMNKCFFGLACMTSQTDFMMKYVVIGWYIASQFVLNSSNYNVTFDVW